MSTYTLIGLCFTGVGLSFTFAAWTTRTLALHFPALMFCGAGVAFGVAATVEAFS